MSHNEREQALKIINGLTKELKESKSRVDILMDKLNRATMPNIKHEEPTNVKRILADAENAMLRNVKRIEKEILNAKSKQSKGK